MPVIPIRLVRKTLRVRNSVTDKEYEILNGVDGRRLITSLDGSLPAEQGMDHVFHGSQMYYELKVDQYVVQIAGTPIALTVYRLGGQYFAARSNEFGYANYEIRQVSDVSGS